MLSWILRLSCLLALLSGCRSPWYEEPPEHLLQCHMDRMCYKYDLELVHVEYWYEDRSFAKGEMNGITVVYYGRSFEDVDTARKITVEGVNMLLKTVEGSSELQKRLGEPLTLENLEFRIDLDSFLGDYLTAGYVDQDLKNTPVGHVHVCGGFINYYSFDDTLVVREPYGNAEEIYCLYNEKERENAECAGLQLLDQAVCDYYYCGDEEDDLLLPMGREDSDMGMDPEDTGFQLEQGWTGDDPNREFDPDSGFKRFDEDNFLRQEDVRY